MLRTWQLQKPEKLAGSRGEFVKFTCRGVGERMEEEHSVVLEIFTLVRSES